MTELKFKDIRSEPYLLEYFFIYSQLTSAPVIPQERFINILKNLPENNTGMISELEKLNELYKSGALSEEEFNKAKAKLLKN